MNEQLTQLFGYLHGMWRYRWSALFIAWVVALLGWVVVLSLPNQYEAKTVVYVDTSSVLKPLLKGLALETDSQDELRIMTRVLLSRDNLMTVIRETDMDLEINSTEEKEDLLKRLAKSIKIKGGSGKKKSNVYEIKYRSSSANRAYQVVSNLLNTMIEDTLKSTRTDTVSAQKFLNTQISKYEERLSLAEQNLALFKKENLGYMPGDRGTYYIRLQRAKDVVEETTSTLQLANRRYSELSKQLKGEHPILSSDGYQSENAKKIEEYQSQLDLLLYKYTEHHPKVVGLEQIINKLKATPDSWDDTADSDAEKALNPIYQEIKVELNKTAVEIELLKIKLKKQQGYVNKLSLAVDIIPEVEAKLKKLNRGYNVTMSRYINLVGRSESAKLAQSADENSSNITFRVIEPPIVPFAPSGPNRPILLSGVLLAALAAGLGWGFLRYFLQPTFVNNTDLFSATNLPVLGSINLYLTPLHKKRRRMQLLFFTSIVILLVITFGIVFLLRDQGVSLFASIIQVNRT